MTATPMELVLSRLPNAKKNAKGWTAQCPAHDDRKPSLSVAEGHDRRVLLHCHARCSVDDVCGALGLKVSDLMVNDGTDIDRTSRSSGNAPVVSTSTGPAAFENAEEAIAFLERGLGKASAVWSYHNAKGDGSSRISVPVPVSPTAA